MLAEYSTKYVAAALELSATATKNKFVYYKENKRGEEKGKKFNASKFFNNEIKITSSIPAPTFKSPKS